MAVNKVVYGASVLVDLTQDTVNAAALQKGYRAHGSDGELIIGTLEPGETETATKISGVTLSYSSGTKLTASISSQYENYKNITVDQIIVALTHFGATAAGSLFGSAIDTDLSIEYTASTGTVALISSKSIFRSTSSNIADIYVVENVSGGTKVPQIKTATPALTTQRITADEGYELERVDVQPVSATLLAELDPDFKASNIRSGVSILGLDGSLNVDGGGGSFDPSPWRNIEVGFFTGNGTKTFSADLSNGTPAALVVMLAAKGGSGVGQYAIISSVWYNNAFDNSARVATTGCGSNESQLAFKTDTPTYSNGVWTFTYQFRSNWTYNYAILYL